MLRVYAGVVGKHELLVFYDYIGVFFCEKHTAAVHSACRCVGKVAHIVDKAGEYNEENEAEQTVFEKLPNTAIILEPAYPVYQPYHREACTGI